MNNSELISKITGKKEFSQLPKKDVELAFSKFNKKNLSDYQKLKLTRDLLRKIYSSFSSRKLLGSKASKEKEAEWVLKKHKSTKERFPYYEKLYGKLLKGFKGTVIDLGCGVNGFSYSYLGDKVNYVGVEAVGQLVDLTNRYFNKNKISGKVIYESLFNLDGIKKIIKKTKRPRIIFLFKVIDSLEVLKRNYSKELLSKITFLADRVAVSFATKSLGKRKKFYANRGWLIKFINDNFKVLDDFEINGERYVVFRNEVK